MRCAGMAQIGHARTVHRVVVGVLDQRSPWAASPAPPRHTPSSESSKEVWVVRLELERVLDAAGGTPTRKLMNSCAHEHTDNAP